MPGSVMSSSDILKIKRCGDIFEQDELKIKSKYRELAKLIHPDLSDDPDAQKAFEHLTNLYNKALTHIQKGTWDKTGSIWITKTNIFSDVLKKKTFELGVQYVSSVKIAYILNDEKYSKNHLDMLRLIKYKDSKMKDLYSYKIPYSVQYSYDVSGKPVITIGKKSSEYPMDLFLSAYGKKLTARDICWMISRLCDLCCFVNYQGLVLNGFTESNLYIDSDSHSISVYGGWWYATKIGDKMIGTSRDIYDCMSNITKTNKLSSPQTDIESIRAIAGRLASYISDVPKPILDWINLGSSDDPIFEYQRWNEALDKAYGKRKFVVFSADADEIYSHDEN